AKRPRFAITASTVFCTSSHCLSTSSHPGSLIVSSSGFVGSSHPIRRPGEERKFPGQPHVARSTTRRENHALLHRGPYYPPLQSVLSRGRLPRSALSPHRSNVTPQELQRSRRVR